MLIHDYLVPQRSLEQIESFASDLRKRLGIDRHVRVDVFSLLFEEMPQYLKDRGVSLISRPAGYMGERDAYAVSKPDRIFYRPRLQAQLKMGVRKARVEFIHELGHIFLHPGAEKAWVAAGNEIKDFISEEDSAEWQATTFALCFLAPRHLADECQSPSDLADRFGIDSEHAAKRFDQIIRRRRRKLPPIYHEVRRELAGMQSAQAYLDERCSDCGERKLIRIDNKYRCATCGRVSDNFQDGDLVGHDFT